MLERRRKQMPFHVMDTDQRNSEGERKRFREAHADEQRPDQSRRIRHGHCLHVGLRHAGVGEPRSTTGTIAVRCARDDLGHDTAEDPWTSCDRMTSDR